MCQSERRQFLSRLGIGGLLLTPLAATLSGCKKDNWPDSMVEIKWDRDTCVRCSMVISDRRFAAQLRGGPENTAFKFDDPGCLAFWPVVFFAAGKCRCQWGKHQAADAEATDELTAFNLAQDQGAVSASERSLTRAV